MGMKITCWCPATIGNRLNSQNFLEPHYPICCPKCAHISLGKIRVKCLAQGMSTCGRRKLKSSQTLFDFKATALPKMPLLPQNWQTQDNRKATKNVSLFVESSHWDQNLEADGVNQRQLYKVQLHNPRLRLEFAQAHQN